jgi:4-phospho-D-threonate 3-dehydrogenase / 4-phospho-D-erythronate 3-dehydrogenase
MKLQKPKVMGKRLILSGDGMNPDKNRPICVVVSPGDPGGIGLEVVLKAIHNSTDTKNCAFVICADIETIQNSANRHQLRINLKPFPEAELKAGITYAAGWGMMPEGADKGCDTPKPGLALVRHHPNRNNGLLAWSGLAYAVDLVKEDPTKRILLTAPICKESMSLAGFSWPGHTEYLSWRDAGQPNLMLLHSPNISVGLVSNHLPVKTIADALISELIEEKIRLMYDYVHQEYPMETLKILSLNPHAGDGGLLGREELDTISPLIKRLQNEGLKITGPLPADSAMASGKGRFLAMYHDQGLPVFKLCASDGGVNITLGLSFVRVSPDHGTAFNIADKSLAACGSTLFAIKSGIQLIKRKN